ncbi:hypothetical protein [Puia sp.]|uniref:hypothetical protein n=1 Tax=Puia sp. TaxID=2045100 RepID=UPI002F405473
MPPSRKDLESPMGGLFLMMIFTTIWTVIAEVALEGKDYGLIGGFFLLILLYFLAHYVKFYRVNQTLPKSADSTESAEDRKRARQFLYIFGTEGLAILVVKNVLVNTNLDYLFIPCLALIIGLHFFPLATIFKRRFDYYVGGWTTLVGLVGLALIVEKMIPPNNAIAIVAIGCALATAANGVRAVINGNRILGRSYLD